MLSKMIKYIKIRIRKAKIKIIQLTFFQNSGEFERFRKSTKTGPINTSYCYCFVFNPQDIDKQQC